SHRGWSSDVCSLDLAREPPNARLRMRPYGLARKLVKTAPSRGQKTLAIIGAQHPGIRAAHPRRLFEHRIEHGCNIARRGIDDLRSEERRVGKDGSCE